jgi:hypothetical protein
MRQEFRSSGVQEFRSSGVQEFRSSGVPWAKHYREIPRIKFLIGAPNRGTDPWAP